MHNPANKNRGFTIMQLMVTVGLIGILSSMAFPSLIDIVTRNKLTATANQLVTALNIARSEAISRHVSVTLRKKGGSSAGWESGFNIFVDSNNFGVFDAGETLLKTFEALPSGYTVKPTTNNYANFVRYQSDGTTTSTVGGSFAACYNNQLVGAKLIIINKTGRIRMGSDGHNGNPKDGIPEKDGSDGQISSCTSP